MLQQGSLEPIMLCRPYIEQPIYISRLHDTQELRLLHLFHNAFGVAPSYNI